MKLTEKSRHINDIILIVVLIIISCIVSAIIYDSSDDTETKTVEVSVDGQIIATYTLGDNSDYNTEYLLETGNFLVIEDGEVYLKSADCPDKLCVKQGKISRVGQSIVCLPRKVVIRITSEAGKTDGLDVMPR